VYVLQPSAKKVIVYAYDAIETGERLNAETLSVDCDGNCWEKFQRLAAP
jgi:hypothetical protein